MSNQINQSPPVNIVNKKSTINPKVPLFFFMFIISFLIKESVNIAEKIRVQLGPSFWL